jgi:hypothetical protein
MNNPENPTSIYIPVELQLPQTPYFTNLAWRVLLLLLQDNGRGTAAPFFAVLL